MTYVTFKIGMFHVGKKRKSIYTIDTIQTDLFALEASMILEFYLIRIMYGIETKLY